MNLFLLQIMQQLRSFLSSFIGLLKKISWRGWLIIALIVLLLLGGWFIHQARIKAAERERELIRELARAQGQVELGDGVIYASALKIDNLYRRLADLHGENSTLREKIDRRIEVPVISIETEIRYRDRVVYVYEPGSNDNQGTATTTIDTTVDEDGQIIENAIVEFDLLRPPFRLFGRTESVGPRISIEMEQVDPFRLGVVVTRERRTGEWNLFIEDQSETLEISVNHFVVDDNSLTRQRLVDRIGVGGSLGGSSSVLHLGAHGSLDLGRRTTVWAGPQVYFQSQDESFGNPNIGLSTGFSFRPFIKR
jgi:hypothetical protein